MRKYKKAMDRGKTAMNAEAKGRGTPKELHTGKGEGAGAKKAGKEFTIRKFGHTDPPKLAAAKKPKRRRS